MQFDTEFFWYRNLVWIRALLYSVKETGNHVTKITSDLLTLLTSAPLYLHDIMALYKTY